MAVQWILIALIISGLAQRADGQHLQIHAPVDLPDPRELTGAADLARTIESELPPLLAAHEQASADGESHRALATLSRIRYRVIAAELLGQGGRYGERSTIAVAAGMRLAAVRDELDARLSIWADGDGGAMQRDGAGDPVGPLLAQFTDIVLAATADIDVRDVNDLDQRLATGVEPLARAVSILVNTPLADHWLTDATVSDAAQPPGAAHVNGAAPRSIEDLHAHLDAVTGAIGDERAARIRRAIDLIARTLAAADLPPSTRSDVVHYRRAIAAYLPAAASLDAATWTGPRLREQWTDRLHSGADALSDPGAYPGGRERAFAFAHAVGLAGRTVAALTEVHTRPRHAGGTDVRDLAALVDSALDNAIGTAPTGREQLRVLERVSRGMAAWRRLDTERLPRDLRPIDARLRDGARALEMRLLRDLPDLIDDPSLHSNPALISMVRDLEQVETDLKRLGMLETWSQQVEAIDPGASAGVERQLRKMCHWLLDPMRRDDGLRAMNRFERQLQHAMALPFEEALKRPDAAAIECTGGLQVELLECIDEQRRAWARSWSVGDGASDAAVWLTLLHRLTRTMAVQAAVLEQSGGALMLNRWAAWDLDPALARRITEDTTSRLKLATAMAVRGNRGALRQHLVRMQRDMPIAHLANRLVELIGDDLRDLPGATSPLLSALSQTAQPPSPSAWQLSARHDLAGIARWAYEAEHARANDRPDLAARLDEWIAQRADALLSNLGASDVLRGPLAPLPGFDGSDPAPDVERIRTPRRRPRR